MLERSQDLRNYQREMSRYGLWLLLVCLWATGEALAQPKPPEPPLVHISKAIIGSVAQTSDFVGTAIPSRRTIVGSAVDGRVVSLNVEVGAEVKEGEPIAQLLTKTLELELAAARAEYKLRQAELAELRNGALPQEIAQAKSRVAAAEVRRNFLRKRLERLTKLDSGVGIVSDEELQEVQSLLDAGDEQVSEAMEGLRLVELGPRPERIAQAEAKLEQQENIVALLEDRLAKYTVRAPFSGFVIRELTESGYWLQQGAPVAEIIEINHVDVEVYVPEGFIRFIRSGDPAPLKFDALPDIKEPLVGKVIAIVPEAETRSRTFPVRVRLENQRIESGFLVKPGMLARCSLPIGPTKEAILIPKDALVLGQVGNQVMRIEDGKAQRVKIEVGVSQGSWIEAKSGIEAGDALAVFGNERLRDGETVKVGKVIEAAEVGAVAQPTTARPAVSESGVTDAPVTEGG